MRGRARQLQRQRTASVDVDLPRATRSVQSRVSSGGLGFACSSALRPAASTTAHLRVAVLAARCLRGNTRSETPAKSLPVTLVPL